MSTRPALLVLAMLLPSGCGVGTPKAPVANADQPPAAAAIADQSLAEPADIKTAVAGNNQFALDVYGQLREEPGNLFFSPYSISAALAMTYAGARTQTAEEMAKTLHFTLPGERLHAAMGKLQADLIGGDTIRAYQLNVANALWGQKGFGLLPDLLNLTQTYYGTGFHEVNFGNSEATRKTINDWVEKQTQDKIKELLKPGHVNELTRLVLTNAIYFKGDWLAKFDKAKTTSEPFFLSASDSVNVNMMQINIKPALPSFRYTATSDFQALELPYAGKELSMVVLLPDAKDGLPAVEKKLTAELLEKLFKSMVERPVAMVALPKFQMTLEYSLKDVLVRLGMRRAFDKSQADFSGIAGTRNGLHITAVVHKAFVEVNEEGTEAAAATAVVIGYVSAGLRPTFRADHPFLFLIRDNPTGAILFMGRVVDPRDR